MSARSFQLPLRSIWVEQQQQHISQEAVLVLKHQRLSPLDRHWTQVDESDFEERPQLIIHIDNSDFGRWDLGQLIILPSASFQSTHVPYQVHCMALPERRLLCLKLPFFEGVGPIAEARGDVQYKIVDLSLTDHEHFHSAVKYLKDAGLGIEETKPGQNLRSSSIVGGSRIVPNAAVDLRERPSSQSMHRRPSLAPGPLERIPRSAFQDQSRQAGRNVRAPPNLMAPPPRNGGRGHHSVRGGRGHGSGAYDFARPQTAQGYNDPAPLRQSPIDPSFFRQDRPLSPSDYQYPSQQYGTYPTYGNPIRRHSDAIFVSQNQQLQQLQPFTTEQSVPPRGYPNGPITPDTLLAETSSASRPSASTLRTEQDQVPLSPVRRSTRVGEQKVLEASAEENLSENETPPAIKKPAPKRRKPNNPRQSNANKKSGKKAVAKAVETEPGDGPILPDRRAGVPMVDAATETRKTTSNVGTQARDVSGSSLYSFEEWENMVFKAQSLLHIQLEKACEVLQGGEEGIHAPDYDQRVQEANVFGVEYYDQLQQLCDEFNGKS